MILLIQTDSTYKDGTTTFLKLHDCSEKVKDAAYLRDTTLGKLVCC